MHFNRVVGSGYRAIAFAHDFVLQAGIGCDHALALGVLSHKRLCRLGVGGCQGFLIGLLLRLELFLECHHFRLDFFLGQTLLGPGKRIAQAQREGVNVHFHAV